MSRPDSSTSLQAEKEMLEAFTIQTQELIASQDRFIKDNYGVKIGLESELAIHGRFDNTELTQKRDAVIADNKDFTDIELGANQIEIRTPPLDILSSDGLASLDNIYRARYNAVLESARRNKVGLLRIGANPFLPTINTPRTDKPKYRLVPDFYNQHRDPRLDTFIGLGKSRIDIGDASVVSLFQSFQVNLEAKSLDDACEKMNRSLAIAPYLLAFSGNARYLSHQDTKIQDTRMMSWEISHDTRTFYDTKLQDLRIISWERSFDVRPEKNENWSNELRIGLPSRYFRNMTDYFQRAGTFPFILYAPESALAISIGMTWLDARTKFIGDSAIVELRLPSTQPTIEEEMLLTLLYIGRLHYAQTNQEQILPINMVRENRLSAMLYGFKKSMWFLSENGAPIKLPTKIGLARELELAIIGLNQLGLSTAIDKELLDAVLKTDSPSDRLARFLDPINEASITDMEDALSETKMLIS
ncbi:MAG: hypothetical protein HYT62_01815 [Candidatus Yanofskybacteria bacterium]|nr:hypothetical protein [Candidatus Yanofskybacteria bacterium]